MTSEHVVELVEYTDPYCTWCWGSEPILRRIKEVYGDQVKVAFKMGGLVEDIRIFYDPLNQIGGDRWAEKVAEHWLDASRRHGMPVDEKVFPEIAGSFKSTYPANIAYKAAQFQSDELADRFLRRMREAAAAERRHIHERDVQLELAGEVGLDTKKFLSDIESGRAEKAFYDDLVDARSLGVTGFPTFYLRNKDGDFIILRGYKSFEDFRTVIRNVTRGTAVERNLEPTLENILSFITRHKKVATKEVAEVFDLKLENAEAKLDELRRKGAIERIPAGNGAFWKPS